MRALKCNLAACAIVTLIYRPFDGFWQAVLVGLCAAALAMCIVPNEAAR